jgi:hypothetical protein
MRGSYTTASWLLVVCFDRVLAERCWGDQLERELLGYVALCTTLCTTLLACRVLSMWARGADLSPGYGLPRLEPTHACCCGRHHGTARRAVRRGFRVICAASWPGWQPLAVASFAASIVPTSCLAHLARDYGTAGVGQEAIVSRAVPYSQGLTIRSDHRPLAQAPRALSAAAATLAIRLARRALPHTARRAG